MKRLILHIGPQKTGSTYLQKKLYEARDELLTHGVRYPGDVTIFGHHDLAMHYVRKVVADAPALLAELQAPSEHDTVVSSELFSRIPGERLPRLREDLGAPAARIIYYLRSPSERMFSMWCERVKHGEWMSYFEFASMQFAKPAQSVFLNPLVTLDDYGEVFGRENIFIVNYEDARNRGEMLKRFFAAAGLPVLLEDSDEEVNPPMPVPQIEIIRSLNALARDEKWLNGPNVRNLFVDCFANRKDEALNDLVEELQGMIARASIPVPSGGLEIDRGFAREIRERYGQQLDEPALEWPEKQKKLPASQWLFDARAMQGIRGVYAIVKRLGEAA